MNTCRVSTGRPKIIQYSNLSIFTDMLHHLLNRLQSVLNAAARLVSHARKYDHVTHLLRDLPLVVGSGENTLPTGRACLPLSSQHGASVPRP